MDAQITVLHQSNASLAEGPVWDPRRRALYWVDIRRCRIHRFSVDEGRQDGVWSTHASVGCVGLTHNPDVLVVAAGADVFLLDLRIGQQTLVARLPIDPTLMRANDGRVDRHGNLWLGTMIDDIHSPDKFTGGRLFCIRPDGSVHDSGFEFELPNGMAWSPQGTTFYINDSTALKTYAFDFDARLNVISLQRVLFAHPPGDGLPDGLTVDADGNLWSGQWNGWNIKTISPSGQLVGMQRVPVQRPSSVAFFGADLGRLAFTSAANGLEIADLIAAPDAGSLFAMTVSAAGQAESYFGS